MKGIECEDDWGLERKLTVVMRRRVRGREDDELEEEAEGEE